MKGDDDMSKKIIAALLAILMIVGVTSTVSFADAGVSEIYTIFADYQLEQNKVTDDFGMEVIVTSYADDSVESNDSLILYVINHNGEYPGTESDETIIDDFLADGYVVAVLDYQDAPLAVSPNIETSIQTIRAKLRGANSAGTDAARSKQQYLGSRNGMINPNSSFVIPAGYRLKRDVVYFEMMTHGSQAAIDYTVKIWNTQESVAKAVYDAGYTDMVTKTDSTYAMKEEAKAKTWEDIIMKDGSKMELEDTQLKLDIIYPSKPVKETPVAVLASSGTPRGNNGVKVNRQHNVGFLFRGYTTVCYDHEYMAFMNTEVGGWGHFEPAYTVQGYDGVKTHTAAIRCIKYYADEYGYSDTNIGVYGHSKSSWSSLLTNPESENLPENQNGVYPGLNAQPFLKDKNGNPIDATIGCAYHSMGNGSSRYATYLTSQNVPTIICDGQKDSGNGNSYWEKEKAAYLKSGIEYLAIDMEDLGHDYPNGDDTVYDYNRYEAFCKFFDYYLKNTAPEILYTSVNDGQLKTLKTTTDKHSSTSEKWQILEGDVLFVQFSAPVTEWSFLEAVTLKDSKGNVVKGIWYAQGNGNRWSFEGHLIEGETYTLTIADNTAKDKYGVAVANGTTVEFTK